jgi:hypothetical protein
MNLLTDQSSMLGITKTLQIVLSFLVMEACDWFSFALSGCWYSYAVKRR